MNLLEGKFYTCSRCLKDRFYNKYEIKYGRPTKYCQPCSVAVYNETRPKQSKLDRLAKQKLWTKANRKNLNKWRSNYLEKLRHEMIVAYGGKCVKCNEIDPIVLVLDHIHDDAPSDRKENGHNGGYKMYLKLRKAGWPKDRHQLLCHNCNFRKEWYRRKNAVFNS